MRKRIAIINRDKCHPHECGNYLCAKLCPVNRTGVDCITPDKITTKAKIDEFLCTGCGICPKRCPFGAIEILNLPDTLNKFPLHRYGDNMFELYSLPAPLFGQVTGIVGRNGLGKSTAFKILSNHFKPNLGNWQNPPDFKEILAYFKGTETQKFLQKLNLNQIQVSYKPQQIDAIPKQFSGTARELLTKIDKQNQLTKIADQLQLTNFLDNEIKTISGGELQRIALAATALKEANLFLFDEPSSYLDIKQRVNMSKFIRNLTQPEIATIVVEHDLIILDYITDLVNIMYGHEGAFGIVSGVKNSREGINAYLEGYLKEENVRFRDHHIKFDKSNDPKKTMKFPLLTWKNLSKQLGNFHLSTSEGTLHKNEIVGILGENGIGKTSFIKLLAGLIKPDFGELDIQVKVAYKPQYLESNSDLLVSEFLQRTIERYEAQLIKPLDLEKLFTQKLSELSGGQLQRVSIAYCLSQDAQLFLLDEPSAYLDVEQRLLISKIIKNIAFERDLTIMVVDHDLMFLDYISDKLIVFTGAPAQNGLLRGPFKMEEGMNLFLQELDITLRRDITSHRPRINKPASVKDREQRAENKWYYS
ncbi:ribosome biogenesis/translation initiation ATPase RLI [Candidatus Woesearchaeota archaeon]|nr:ribosome biogenesis/translation initiation ATPase RLI [Candidatus Woesearchaeota archaeon]